MNLIFTRIRVDKIFQNCFLNNKGKQLTEDDMERVLSWTFCKSIYESICQNKKSSNYSECNREISNDLRTFFATCLAKQATKNSFTKLKTMNWLKYDLALAKIS